MAAPSYETFLARFAGFKTFESLNREAIEQDIAAASIQLNEPSWGAQYTEGVLQLAAHLVVMNNRAHCCKTIKDADTLFLANYERMAERIISADRVF